MPKQQTGQLIWKEELGWYGRYYATIDGDRVRVCRALHTDNRVIAKRKLARLIAEGNVSAEAAQRPETFQDTAERVVEEQRKAGMTTWKNRSYRLRTFVFPLIGAMDPKNVKASHVKTILGEVREAGLSRQTMVHTKNDISTVLKELWQAELLPENVCLRVKVPEATAEATERSKKERAVMTDQELVQYLGWQHPDELHRTAALERQVMSCLARMFGGLRTSDIHAVKWEGFELPGFERGYAPRRKGANLAKGGKPQKLTVPEMLRPILADWWQRQGRPAAGLLFPKLRGDDAGTGKRKHSSHAKAFRSDLRRAFGIESLVWKEDPRSNGREHRRQVWEDVRGLTAREQVLLETTESTLPADFHSWRRAFSQALADANVNSQQAKSLAGHSSDAHDRYLRNTQKLLTIPSEALPQLTLTFGHNPMGTLAESGEVPANASPENSLETPLKAAIGQDSLASGAVGQRFESFGVHRKTLDSESERAHRVPMTPKWVGPKRREMVLPPGTVMTIGRAHGSV